MAITPAVIDVAPLTEGQLDTALAMMAALTTVAAGLVVTTTSQKRQKEADDAQAQKVDALAKARADQQAALKANLAENMAKREAAQEVVYVEAALSDWMVDYQRQMATYHERLAAWHQAVVAERMRLLHDERIPDIEQILAHSHNVEDVILQQYYALRNLHGADDSLVRNLGYMQYLIRTARENEDYTALLEHINKSRVYMQAGATTLQSEQELLRRRQAIATLGDIHDGTLDKDWLNLSTAHLEQRLAGELPQAIARIWGGQMPGVDPSGLGLAEMKETYYVLKDTLNSLQSITGDLSHTSIVTLSRENYDANQRLLRRIEMEAMPQFVSADPFFISAFSTQMSTDTIRQLLDTTFMLAVEGDMGVYQDAIYDTLGIRFTGYEWSLLGIHFTRFGAQRIAQAFDVYGNIQEIPITGYEIYRQVFGDMNFENVSTESTIDKPDDNTNNALGRYSRSNVVEVFMRGDAPAILTPNLVIHELGHAFNAFAGLGYRLDRGSGNINEISGNEGIGTDRSGMGHPRPDRLLSFSLRGTVTNEEGESWEAMFRLPDMDVLGSQSPPRYLTYLDILRQSGSFLRTEETADAFLNWVWHTNTGGKAGFTPDETGQTWINLMDDNMVLWIRNAILHNMPIEDQMAIFVEYGYIPQNYGTVMTPSTVDGLIRSVPDSTSDETIITGIGVRPDETYVILGRIQDSVGINFIETYRNGEIVYIYDQVFDWGTAIWRSSQNISHYTQIPSSDGAFFLFDPSSPLSDTPWWEHLLSTNP